MKLENPKQRNELIEELHCLSDHSYLVKHWVDLDYDTSKLIINFDETVHFLFDDTLLADDPSKLIGYCLVNQEEVSAVSKVVAAIDAILSRYGTDLSDEEYLSKKEWDQVESAAKSAYEVMVSTQGKA